MEIIKKLDELYGMINSIMVENRIEEKEAGNLHFISGNNQFLNKEKTFKKLNESLDVLEEVKFDIQHELSKLSQHDVIACVCNEEDKHGWTEIKCCNKCGKPIEDFWCKH